MSDQKVPEWECLFWSTFNKDPRDRSTEEEVRFFEDFVTEAECAVFHKEECAWRTGAEWETKKVEADALWAAYLGAEGAVSQSARDRISKFYQDEFDAEKEARVQGKLSVIVE